MVSRWAGVRIRSISGASIPVTAVVPTSTLASLEVAPTSGVSSQPKANDARAQRAHHRDARTRGPGTMFRETTPGEMGGATSASLLYARFAMLRWAALLL